MKIEKGIRRFFENGYRQARGWKRKKSMSFNTILKKLIKKLKW
tara:strand:- start:7 stop:135 length:129 start_codon:yes stop_codon:yes gene_type:complete